MGAIVSPQVDGFAPGRLVSLDAYRGTVMLLLAASLVGVEPKLMLGFFPHNAFWTFLQGQWTHSAWEGCTLWDLIQPSFMFLVGVSLPFSYGKRQRQGQSYLHMFRHACFRSTVLVLLGVFLRSRTHEQTFWTFEDVVTQIGLGYVFLFLLWDRGWKVQAAAAAGILVGYWLLWVYWPAISGVLHVQLAAAAGWPKQQNPGQAFDIWFRNLFPTEAPFTNWSYYTLNFIPSLATMIFGLMAGHLLRNHRPPTSNLKVLVIAGVAGIAFGWLLDWTQICPLIKKLWTSSWTLFSTGWCLLFLAAFYWVIDVRGWRRPFFPAVVLGVNSIGIYVLAEMWNHWLPDTLGKHLNHTLLHGASPAAGALVRNCVAAVLLWLIFYWMYRRKIFLRI